MKMRTVFSGLAGSAIGVATMIIKRRGRLAPSEIAVAATVGMAAGVAADLVSQIPKSIATMESLMPKPQMSYSSSQIVKETPASLFADRGSGLEYETRLSTLDEFLTPNDRFYVRSHCPTPILDVQTWRLTIDGDAVETPVDLTYEELCAMPQTTCALAIECAGNGRRFFKEFFGVAAEGGQWRTGAIGCAEWTGVRLRDVLACVRLKDDAGFVMPEGLDEHKVKRPMPFEKALRDDTLLALKMNGETLPADHGFPARIVVAGWVGTASIKWVGHIHVTAQPPHVPFNTMEYIMEGPHYPMEFPAMGPPITEMPVTSVLDLDWPAKVGANVKTIRGRAYAGEGRVKEVVYRVDNAPWRQAEILTPNLAGAWVRWQFEWNPEPGCHDIRVRATDEKGRTQPEHVPWNHHGYLYNAIVAHPVTVS